MTLYPFVTRAGDHSLTLNGTFNTGTTVLMSWDAINKAVPSCGVYFYAVSIDVIRADNSFYNIYYSQKPFNDPGSGQASGVLTSPGVTLVLDVFADAYCSSGTIDVTQFASTPGATCVYGTQPQPGAAATAEITATLVSTILLPVGLEWLAPVFGVLFGYWVQVGPLCATLPPPAPVINLSTLNSTWDTAWMIFQWAAWPYWCQCTPGTPAPNPPTLPGGNPPPGWPVAPAFPCSNTDVCSAIIALSQNVATLLDQTQTIGQLVTLLQRYRLPFAYTQGRTHTNIMGQGTLTIDRLIGVTVNITATNTPQRTLFGQPGYEWDLGWMSVTDGGGMLQEKRITRLQQDWFPEQCQLATVLGYALIDGVTMNLTELKAET